MKSSIKMISRAMLAIALLLSGLSQTQAADISATATLSSQQTTVGRPVQLTLRVEGAREVGEQPEIIVDGLQVSPMGRGSQFQMFNFDVKIIVDLTYQVLPLREGTFTIPSIEVQAGKQIVKTQPLTLTVSAGAQPPTSPQQGVGQVPPDEETAEGNSDLVFAELIVPKSSAYVGETVPIEIRVYFDSRLRYQIEGMPELDTASFTMKQMPEPRREQRTLKGRPYDVIVFNTALTPLKPGSLNIGPVTTEALVQSPVQRRGAPQSLFDSLFDDPFFGSAFQRMQTQRVRISADSVPLQVLDVPAQGRPASFQGAVGNFDMEVNVDLRQTSVGSPLTVRAVVSGRGDFDRVGAPTLSNMAGWRSYPPSSDFQADDTLGISGTKTFQILVIPDEVKSELPPLEFSYFDPATETFKTLRSDPIPITVAPGVAPPPSPATSATAPPPPSSQSTSSEPTTNQPTDTARYDILHIKSGSQTWRTSFDPFYRTRGFWLLQAAALAMLACGVGAFLWWTRMQNADRLARLAVDRKLADTKKRAVSAVASDSSRLAAAVDFIRLATSQQYGIAAPLVDAQAAIQARSGLDANVTAAIQSIFQHHDESAFAAGSLHTAAPALSTIADTLDAISHYDKHHARH